MVHRGVKRTGMDALSRQMPSRTSPSSKGTLAGRVDAWDPFDKMTAVPRTIGEAHFDHGTTVAVFIR